TADRLVIGYLKALGFLTPSGEPTPRYYAFLDQSQGARILADTLREVYSDLFQVNAKAPELSNSDLKNKIKTLTQGQYSSTVLEKMASTFKAVSGLADFSAPLKPPSLDIKQPAHSEPSGEPPSRELPPPFAFGGFFYNIQIHLPESRDPAVYDALFRSLR